MQAVYLDAINGIANTYTVDDSVDVSEEDAVEDDTDVVSLVDGMDEVSVDDTAVVEAAVDGEVLSVDELWKNQHE